MDPRVADVVNRNAKRKPSPLILALEAAGSAGARSVNFCPFGCDTGDLDDNGYCYHLIGFTKEDFTKADWTPGTAELDKHEFKGTPEGKRPKRFEPMVPTKRILRGEDGKPLRDEKNKIITVEGGGRVVECKTKRSAKTGRLVLDLPVLLKGDRLVQITNSWRVYRDVPRPKSRDEEFDEDLIHAEEPEGEEDLASQAS